LKTFKKDSKGGSARGSGSQFVSQQCTDKYKIIAAPPATAWNLLHKYLQKTGVKFHVTYKQ